MILEKLEALYQNYNHYAIVDTIKQIPENEWDLEIVLHYARALNNTIEYQEAIDVLNKYKEGNTRVEWHYIQASAYHSLADDAFRHSGKLSVLKESQEYLNTGLKLVLSGLKIDGGFQKLKSLFQEYNALKIILKKAIEESLKFNDIDFSTLTPKQKAALLLNKLNETRRYYMANDLLKVEVFDKIKNESNGVKKEIIIELIHLIDSKSHKNTNTNNITTSIGGLIRSNLDYSEKEWIFLFSKFLESIGKGKYPIVISNFPINYSIQQLERYLKKNEASKELLVFINQILEDPSFSEDNNQYWGSDLKKSKKKLLDILSKNGVHTAFKLGNSDIGPVVNNIIDTISAQFEQFNTIFIQASEASQSKPTAKFQKLIKENIEQIGADTYRKIAQKILETTFDIGIRQETSYYKVFLSSSNQQFIKGIIWTMERFSDKETITILSKLFQKGYEKIPGQGPAAASLGNACAYTLGNMRGKEGLGALSRIKLKLKQNNIKKIIDKYLVEGAKKYNVSVEELKEMAVPDFKLEKGIKSISFDDYQLNLNIQGNKVEQQWIKPDGSPMKSVPSAVKNSTTLANQLKVVRKEIKEIQKVYSAQKQRIDNQFILDRTWDFSNFNKYYIHHGLVYTVAQKLIWTFTRENQSVNAILLKDKWYSVEHDLIDWLDDSTTVKLWHPVRAKESEIIAWREKMMDLEWSQPIKQAFRELYILTDAELNTKNYSNRMAAHILKQHQFYMLAGLRGWKYSLMGSYDDGIYNEVCSKYLPEHKITAEFWIDELNDYDAFNDAGIWLYISTDQVKFKNEEGQAMDLVNVPKMVFTEIMRDVDLFVGVASVGNDPQWMDNNGERQESRNYWESYSFGNLTEIAKTRKTILERLLPRLKKIRDKAHIDGKFLIVKGEIRTYKIHIGSGNILMEPNDQYLCIVPSRSPETATNKIFIPFEGDKGLSIVLSKAFLLAEDTKITDSTITSQINHK
ncbi:MAG: DUF4132 domain-containing protein [Flavobacteriales bacterium]